MTNHNGRTTTTVRTIQLMSHIRKSTNIQDKKIERTS